LPKGLRVQMWGFAGFGRHAWLLNGTRAYEHDGSKVLREVELCHATPVGHRNDLPVYSLLATPSGVYA
jgi:hypothetical protein